MTMTAKQFGEMTKTMMRETMVATGGKQVIDKITAPSVLGSEELRISIALRYRLLRPRDGRRRRSPL